MVDAMCVESWSPTRSMALAKRSWPACISARTVERSGSMISFWIPSSCDVVRCSGINLSFVIGPLSLVFARMRCHQVQRTKDKGPRTNSWMDIPREELNELAEHDPVGVETLRRMESVDRYNRWIHHEFAPYIGSRILEVGCGIGNMSEFLRDVPSVVALD